MNILISIWTFWCFLDTFLVFMILFPINCILVFGFGEKGKALFVQYNYYVGNALLFLYGLKREVSGAYPFIYSKPCVYIANHKSYLDVIIMASLIPYNIKYLGKAEVFRWPMFGFFARHSGQIPVKREDKDSRRQAYEEMKKAIDNGFSIVLFPEGGWRNQDSSNAPNPYEFQANQVLNPFRNGAFRLAIEKGVPIVPIAFLNAGHKFSSSTMKLIPGKLKVHDFHLLETKSTDDPSKINEKCYNMISQKLEEYIL